MMFGVSVCKYFTLTTLKETYYKRNHFHFMKKIVSKQKMFCHLYILNFFPPSEECIRIDIDQKRYIQHFLLQNFLNLL